MLLQLIQFLFIIKTTIKLYLQLSKMYGLCMLSCYSPPDSTEDDYYVKHKLFNVFDTEYNFDPVMTRNLVSNLEFEALMVKLQDTFSKQITIQKWLYFLLLFARIAFLTTFIAWLIVPEDFSYSVDENGHYYITSSANGIILVLMIVSFVLNLILIFTLYHNRVDLTLRMARLLQTLNQHSYEKKKCYWTIEERWGRYLHLHLNVNPSGYQPIFIPVGQQPIHFNHPNFQQQQQQEIMISQQQFQDLHKV